MSSASTNEITKPTPTAVAVMPRCSARRSPMTSRLFTTQSGRSRGSPGGIGLPRKEAALQHLADLVDTDQPHHPLVLVDHGPKLDRGGEHRRQGVTERCLRLDQAGTRCRLLGVDWALLVDVGVADPAKWPPTIVHEQREADRRRLELAARIGPVGSRPDQDRPDELEVPHASQREALEPA